MATGLDYFIENSMMLMWFWGKVRAKESSEHPCWFSWAILSSWLFLLILGKQMFPGNPVMIYMGKPLECVMPSRNF